MIFKIIKRHRGFEVFKVDKASAPLNKVVPLDLAGVKVVFTSVVIPEGRVASESTFFTNALHRGIKLIDDHEQAEWRKDFGQI